MTGDLTAETALLTSPEAAGLLELALTGDPEVALPGFTARLDDLHYRPGSEVTAIYTVSYREAGRTRTEYLLATTAEVAGTVATLTSEGITLRVWRHPSDPRLPGMAQACEPETVLGWLAEVDPGQAGPPLELELLSYRPLRRAVLQATTGQRQFFLKVMRPGYDDRLAARQQLLAAADLTTPILTRPAPGVLVSPRIQGHSLAQELLAWQRGDAAPPTPGSLLGLLDSLPAAILDLPRRPSWSENLDFHAATARQQLPDAAERIDQLAAGIRRVLDADRHGPVVPTHGDFYEANVFVDGSTLRFIDVDSVGPGLREDDLACCLAHLAALPSLDRPAYSRVPEVLDAWQHAFEQSVDRRDLRARTAGVLLSLVSGADDLQARRRLEIAELYAASAR